jgi:predicted nucleic acid-binding protein
LRRGGPSLSSCHWQTTASAAGIDGTAVPSIAFDLDIARIHARLDAELSAAGTRIGDGDLMIGATAVRLDYRVATRDSRSFPKIKGLSRATTMSGAHRR